MTNQKGPIGPKLPVVLINPRTSEVDFGVSVSTKKPIVPRAALAEILRRIPINSVKRIGLDVVLDQPAAGTKELAAVLRKQNRQLVFSGWFSSNAAAVDAGNHTKGLSAELIDTPLLTRKLDVNTPGYKSTQQTPQPSPLRLQEAITAENFAGTLSNHPAPVLPASAVIDWSINWGRLIQRIEPADLSVLKATTLLVGTTGNINPDEPDRFKAPGAAAAELAELSGGSSREVPGVFVQAALAQSINLQHWLKPQPLLTITALSSGLGVLLAAAVTGRRRRLQWFALISLISVIASLQLAITSLLLFPLLLPLVALGSATMIRGDER